MNRTIIKMHPLEPLHNETIIIGPTDECLQKSHQQQQANAQHYHHQGQYYYGHPTY
ncbi:hypothetical protein [Paenibacillus aceris]|uniref:Uncharacterized protein n=1 Tax=Paenibacillus aceris TaxID=869555 RepID=A0ABS4I0N4_9BACL|nr:hypothetical protein [Paenibacillus aceris]MBP1964472.1 hypothetical protein [Paenibacillus aceris]NHW35816.1 hypothetical protein [Paenibacillus aceris]